VVVRGNRSHWAAKSHPSAPTRPPVRGGYPGNGSLRRTARASRRTVSTGPFRGIPTGTSPTHSASPSQLSRLARDRTPTKLHRPHAPCSADSSTNVPGRPPKMR